MKYMKGACLAVLMAGLFACAHNNANEEQKNSKNDDMTQKVVALENLKTRVVVYCYNGAEMSVEECVKDMESRGFVRLTDIPKFMADRNVLTTGTYPTRRWRNEDRIPRW